jgi:hypothetical protein
MATTFLTKTQAIAFIGVETGFGRRVIEKAMDTLLQQGRIKIFESPDSRALRISRADMDIIIRGLC